MSPRARYLRERSEGTHRAAEPRDRADFLSRWADRILADRPSLTAAPRCPTCGELVSPGAWDRHQTEHLSDYETYTKEMSE